LLSKLTPYLGSLGLGFLAAGTLLRVAQPARERYWASFLIVGLVLVLVYLVQRWSSLSSFFSRRSTREGANAALLVLMVVLILVAINYIANRHSRQWDFTAARQYTLSDQTMKITGELDRDVEILLFDNPTSEPATAARDLLKLYDDASGRVRTETIDPEARPERALAYQSPTEPGLPLGTVLVVAGERQQRATAATEPEITKALIRALKQETKKLYFTEGHREKQLSGADGGTSLSVIAGRLRDSAYETAPLLIARSVVDEKIRIPDDADAIVVAGPRTDFLPEEIAALDRYLRSGGKAIFLIDPTEQSVAPKLTDFLLELGVVLDNDVVVDAYSMPAVSPVVRSYGHHPIVESFGNAMSVFPLVRSVRAAEGLEKGTHVQVLFATADSESWGETRLDELSQRMGPAPDQRRGPLPLAVALTMPPEGGAESGAETRVVVVGDSDFVSDDLAAAPVLNADLFLNMVNWIVQDEDLIAIRPREPEDRRIFLTPQQQANVFFLSLLIIPGVVVVTGISVWWSRR
jgi:ABC-type uncharacterized transport system involved in gliding motility auxiliary subunit